MQPTLLNDVKIDKVLVTQATGTSALTTDPIDMQGWEGVLFVGALATANAGNSINLAQSDASGGTYSDLEGSKLTPAVNGEEAQIDLFRPTKRYVRAEIVRAGATTVTETFYAIRYRGRKAPVTANGVAQSHVSPDEGTA